MCIEGESSGPAFLICLLEEKNGAGGRRGGGGGGGGGGQGFGIGTLAISSLIRWKCKLRCCLTPDFKSQLQLKTKKKKKKPPRLVLSPLVMCLLVKPTRYSIDRLYSPFGFAVFPAKNGG